MTPFLYQIADAFYRHEGGNLSQIAFVFPNRRSGKFFQQYLAQVADGHSLFSPTILTINSLMADLSQLQPVDKIELLFVIYEEYCKLRQTDELFDKFVFWGEMLASDFDDVDKYMVEADKLFANIKDLKDLEQNYLEPEQVAIIRQFWDTFFVMSDENKKKVEFNSLWSVMYQLYCNVRSRLASDGVGYEGMIFRHTAERAMRKQLPELHTMPSTRKCTRIVFVGFNAITPAERRIMQYYRDNGQGDFYWDYYAPTMQYDDENRANFFIEKNVREFPSHYMPEGLHMITTAPEMTVVPVSSAIGQVKQAGVILQSFIENKDTDPDNAINTAVVLSDEELLMPMIYSIPAEISSINITMGYSLRNTSVASFFDAVSALQRRVRWSGGKPLYYHVEVLAILNHRVVIQCVGKEVVDGIVKMMQQKNMAYISADVLAREEYPLLALIFSPITHAGDYLERILEVLLGCDDTDANSASGEVLTKIEHEYTYHYYNMVSRLNDVIAMHNHISISTATYFAMLGKLSLSIPFDGEPLSGLQVMGVLETRVLDFDNIIILSMNEGTFPKKRVAASFIPYNLRRGYNMATTEHQDSIYAYYFYRMIARAKKVYMLYDSRTEGLKRGEMSRFIYQLKYHYSHLLPNYQVNEYAIAHNIGIDKPPVISIPKEGGVASRLRQFLQGSDKPRALSASGLKTYINCPLQFYMQYVEGLSVEDDIVETVDSSVFGTIYHNVMAQIYDDLKERSGIVSEHGHKVVNVTQSMLNDVIDDTDSLMRYIEREFNVVFYHAPKDAPAPRLTGKNSIIAHTVYIYVKRTLEYDRDNVAPFIYHASEERLGGERELYLPLANGLQVRFKAFIDRIDYANNILRIIDYKTGSDAVEAASVDELFDKRAERLPGAIMQVLLYCKLYAIAYPDRHYKMRPLIYRVRKAFSDFVPILKIAKYDVGYYNDVKERYEELLNNILEELFDESTPFAQTQEIEHCKYCDFKTICKRN